MDNSYWNHNGNHQHLSDQLEELVPVMGSVAKPALNPKLEKFRKAVNCYYDLYNNGLRNRAREFYHAFGIKSSDFKYGGDYSPNLYRLMEEKMDEIVLQAAYEQGLAI